MDTLQSPKVHSLQYGSLLVLCILSLDKTICIHQYSVAGFSTSNTQGSLSCCFKEWRGGHQRSPKVNACDYRQESLFYKVMVHTPFISPLILLRLYPYWLDNSMCWLVHSSLTPHTTELSQTMAILSLLQHEFYGLPILLRYFDYQTPKRNLRRIRWGLLHSWEEPYTQGHWLW